MIDRSNEVNIQIIKLRREGKGLTSQWKGWPKAEESIKFITMEHGRDD